MTGNLQRFKEKRVLVTGAGTGIGAELARAFAREGADVVLHYSHTAQGALNIVDEIRSNGGKAAAYQANFEHLDQVFALADSAFGFLGGIDILINNAGITFNKPLLKVTSEQFDILYSVNVRAQYFLIQRAVEQMQSGSAILNVTSIHGLQGAPEHSLYAGTKGAIIAQTRTLGIEFAHKGIRINAIAPGWVIVESHSLAFPGRTKESAMRDAASAVPAGRAGLPPDVVKVALFLCSEDADFIVGQTIVVDGGTTSLMSLISNFREESNARCGIGYLPGA